MSEEIDAGEISRAKWNEATANMSNAEFQAQLQKSIDSIRNQIGIQKEIEKLDPPDSNPIGA